jgi:hypothetical protein
MRGSHGRLILGGLGLGTVLAVALTGLHAQTPGYQGPRTPDGKPDLNGIWQVLDTADWDLLPHSAQEGVPAGQGVVEGDEIPYQPWALEKKNQNHAQRQTADPVGKCFLPGVPRVMYIPMPFEITQTPTYMAMSFAFAHAMRIIHTNGTPHVEALDFWMGDSRGRWEGDTLVIDTIDFNDRTWFSRAGDFHSDALHVVERLTPTDPTHIAYEATIEDTKVFTRPWKMRMILYRRMERNLQLLDYDCVSFFWKKRAGG